MTKMVLVYRKVIYRPWKTAYRYAFSSTPRADPVGESSSINSEAKSSQNSGDPQRRKSTTNRHKIQVQNSDRDRGKHEVSVATKPGEHSFDAFTKQQIVRARRSLMIRFVAKSPRFYDEAYAEICQKLRSAGITVVKNTGYDSTPVVHSPDGLKTFFLLETTSREPVDEFVQHFARSAASNSQMQPCRTRILHYTGALSEEFRNGMRGDQKKSTPDTDNFALNKALKECLWIDEQMRVLVDETILSEYGVRLRFFVASLIEDAFRGVFPHATCMPFGSTANGFGHSSCDLDMDFCADDQRVADVSPVPWLCAFRAKDDEHRSHTQRMVELIGRMARTCLPYCVDVNRIVLARVPIVKMTHEAGGFGCDITVDNVTGPMCAKILWVYSRLDGRACPLLFTVRRWASSCRITRDTPGSWLTNFQLLCMVIFFLQTHPSSDVVLPPISTLRRLSSPNEHCGIIGDPDILIQKRPNCSSAQKVESKQTQSLGGVLRDFFYFYGHEFAFDRFGIDLESGRPVDKQPLTPLFIPNPLEEAHNIGRNVTPDELERFRSCARKAHAMMERKELMRKNSTGSWGLLALFDYSFYSNVDEKPTSNSRVLLVDNTKWNVTGKTGNGAQNEPKASKSKRGSRKEPSKEA